MWLYKKKPKKKPQKKSCVLKLEACCVHYTKPWYADFWELGGSFPSWASGIWESCINLARRWWENTFYLQKHIYVQKTRDDVICGVDLGTPKKGQGPVVSTVILFFLKGDRRTRKKKRRATEGLLVFLSPFSCPSFFRPGSEHSIFIENTFWGSPLRIGTGFWEWLGAQVKLLVRVHYYVHIIE